MAAPVQAATTSVAAFPGVYSDGPVGDAVRVSSWREFAGRFGVERGQSGRAALGVWQYFLNGGTSAWIVRVDAGDAEALKDALIAQFGDAAALDHIAPDVFNLMCIPDAVGLDEEDQVTMLRAAQAYCERHRALLIVDAPAPVSTDLAGSAWTAALFGAESAHGAAYYPWVTIAGPRPEPGGAPIAVPPSGSVAGVYAKTDATRGVWKAPAGTEAVLAGVLGLTDGTMTDESAGTLNREGINCLRAFRGFGPVVWGARTMAGADSLASEWKYVPVRRTADFVENSVRQSLVWAVFEPNGPRLWAAIGDAVSVFMQSLFMQGALAGSTAREAYYVACDATTTSLSDQAAGIVNVVVGFAAVQPAEFVVIRIQLAAGPAPEPA